MTTLPQERVIKQVLNHKLKQDKIEKEDKCSFFVIFDNGIMVWYKPMQLDLINLNNQRVIELYIDSIVDKYDQKILEDGYSGLRSKKTKA